MLVNGSLRSPAVFAGLRAVIRAKNTLCRNVENIEKALNYLRTGDNIIILKK
jgi:hypothetical protein